MAAPLAAVGSLISGDMVAAAATHAARAAGQAALARIATYIYERVTAVPDLSVTDYDAYQKLIASYREHLASPTDSLPEHWVLDGKKPRYRSTFKEQQECLLAELSRVEAADSALIWQIHGIVTTIGELYCSLDKRVRVFGKDVKTGANQYREDGFESMFYTELAMWLVGVLPTLSLTDKETAAKVGARLNYCRSVYAGVIVYHKDKDIACPRNVLPVVIKALEVLHANLIQAHHAASFSERVSAINHQLTSTIAGSFNVLYMMLEGIRLRDLNVGEVLAPSDGRAVKIKETVHETKLGQWLMETLQVAGIRANDFTCHKNLSITMIHAHLPDVSLSDKEDISTSGLPSFVWWKAAASWIESVTDPTQIRNRVAFKRDPATTVLLTRIRDFHRAILIFCCLRQALSQLAQLQIAYGEKWLFDSDEGDRLFGGLKYALEKSLLEFEQTLNIFWRDFYGERHTMYVEERKTDPTDATYRQLAKADKLVSRIKVSLQKISRSKDDLVMHRSVVLASSEKHVETLRALGAFLCDYLPMIAYPDAHNLAHFRALSLIRGAGAAVGADAVIGAGVGAAAVDTSTDAIGLSGAGHLAGVSGAGSAGSSVVEVISLTPEEQARADMVEVLCRTTGLDKKELQPAWIEQGYQLFLSSYATLRAETQEELKRKYEAAITKAREFAANMMALRLICESLGQEPREIKAEWVEKAARLFLLELQGVSAAEQISAKRDYDAVMQDLDRLKKLAEVKAWLALCDYTGQAPEEILKSWIYKAAPLFLITPATSAAKKEWVRVAYKRTLEMAAEYFDRESDDPIVFPAEEVFPDNTIEALARSQAAIAICRDIEITPSCVKPEWVDDATPLFVMGLFGAAEEQKALAHSEYQNVLARIKASLAAARISADASHSQVSETTQPPTPATADASHSQAGETTQPPTPATTDASHSQVSETTQPPTPAATDASHSQVSETTQPPTPATTDASHSQVSETTQPPTPATTDASHSQAGETAVPLTVESATAQAVELLCQKTGQPPNKIKDNWIDVVARKLLLSPTAPGFREAETAYAATLKEAYDFFNESEEKKVPHTKTLAKHSYPVEEMQLAIAIDKLIKGYLSPTRKKDEYKPQSLPTTATFKALTESFHQAIYATILKPYDWVFRKPTRARFYGYREHHLRSLEKYFSCLSKVLTLIGEESKKRTISEVEFESIKEQLLAVLDCMYRECRWVKAALDLYLKEKPGALVSLTVDGNKLLISSEARIAALESDIAERDSVIRDADGEKKRLIAENTGLKTENAGLKTQNAWLVEEKARTDKRADDMIALCMGMKRALETSNQQLKDACELIAVMKAEAAGRATPTPAPTLVPTPPTDRFFHAALPAAGGAGGVAGPAAAATSIGRTGV
jgi:hypothetical protein